MYVDILTLFTLFIPHRMIATLSWLMGLCASETARLSRSQTTQAHASEIERETH